MPRYVVLSHDWPSPHLDLLLELDDRLRSWRLIELPSIGHRMIAQANFDHRLHYLDYEGPISDNRGVVQRVTAGLFDWLQVGPDRVLISVTSGALVGQVVLEKIDLDQWWLVRLS